MTDDQFIFAAVGGLFSLVAWIILVVPIYGIRNSARRTNELLEELAKQAAHSNANLQSVGRLVQLQEYALTRDAVQPTL